MDEPTPGPRRAWRASVAALSISALAALIGAWLGYGFGRTIGSWPMGVITAVCAAALAAILADAAVDTLMRWSRRR